MCVFCILSAVPRSPVAFISLSCFLTPSSNLLDVRASPRQKFSPSLNSSYDSNISANLFLKFAGGGGKNVTYGLNFRNQSPLTCSGFETEQHIGNPKHPPSKPMVFSFVLTKTIAHSSHIVRILHSTGRYTFICESIKLWMTCREIFEHHYI